MGAGGAWAREGLVGPTDLLRRAGDPVAYRASDVPGLLPAHVTAASPAVATSSAPPPTESVPADPGATTSTDDTGTAPRDPAAYLGLWTGFYWPEPSGVNDDPAFWSYWFSHRIYFEVAVVEGSGGPELRVWGEAVLPPSTEYEPFEGAIPMIKSDGSLNFTIVWTRGTGPAEGAVLHFMGQRTGSQIEGIILGERMATGSTVEGTFTVTGPAES